MNIFNKLLKLLLIALLLCGCNKSQVIKKTDDTPDFLSELKNYKAREKNSDKEDNDKFDAFLDLVFDDLVSENYLYMHFNVADYKTLGIEKPEVSLGNIVYGIDNEEFDETKKLLNELLLFDYDDLSIRQQYDYDLLHYSLLESLCSLYYAKYTLLFSNANQFSSNLVVNLVEFPIYDKESEEDLLTILKLVPDYIEQAIEYTKKQAEDGLYHTDKMLDSEISYIDSLIEDNGFSIYNCYKDYAIYKDAKKIVENDIIPSFKALKEYLNTLYGKTTSEDLALCNLDQNYAEYVYLVNSSNNIDIDELYEELVNIYFDWIYQFADILEDNENIIEDYDSLINSDLKPFNLDCEEMLEYLRNNSSKRYEYLTDATYVVSILDTLDDSTLGYYVTPPIDNLNQNVIRINSNVNNAYYSNMNIYEVMAHEGFPGHLYQNIYFQKTNPHKFRATQSFVGYSEGYADMAAMDAIDMLNIEEDYKCLAKIESTTFNSHILYSILDLGINYYGWDLEALKEKLEILFIDSSYANEIYDEVVAMPGVFIRYGGGFVSHLALRKKAMDALADKFNYVSYNKVILENGPLPFVILEGAVEKYIDENK